MINQRHKFNTAMTNEKFYEILLLIVFIKFSKSGFFKKEVNNIVLLQKS